MNDSAPAPVRGALRFLLLVLLPGVCATAATFGVPGEGAARQVDTTGQLQEEVEPAAPPAAFQIPARARALADSAAQARQTIQRLAGVSGVAAEVDEAEGRLEELRALLQSMVEMEVIRLERLSRLRDQALLEDSRLEGILARISTRLDELGQIQEDWMERRQLWQSWARTLGDEPGFQAVEQEMTTALEGIDAVLAQASDAAGDPLALQRRVEALRVEIQEVGAVVTAIRAGRRQALLERGEPLLLSGQHREQLAEEGWRGWDPTAAIAPSAYIAFVRGHLGLLGFHALLVVLVGVIVRRLRPRIAPEGDWVRLLDQPFTLGLLVSMIVAMVRITLAPPLWDVLLWALFGLAATRLAQRLFEDRALRLTVFLLAVFYPVFMLLEIAQLPEPVFRLGLVAVAGLAIPLFIMLARRAEEDAATRGGTQRRTRSLRVGAGVWIAVALAVVLGFDALGRWMLHVAVMTAAVAFVVVLGFMFLQAAAGTISRSAASRSLWWRGGGLLVLRAIVLLRVGLIVIAALVLLDAWGVAESPVAIWQRLMDLGFSAGAFRFTVGGILTGALVIYLAVLLSGLVASLLAPDDAGAAVSGQPPVAEGDRGLAQSISKLAHYALITLGVVVALAVMGVELQNFAIVAGALGIGVGFGLQNVVNNFASGLILLLERPVRVGDTVVVGEEWGTIRKIGLRSTVMLTLDQSEMIVPNADLVSEKVINWTLTSPIARIILPVGVAYGSPVDDVLRILEETAFAHESVLDDPPPQALFVGFGDSALDFELRIWVQNIRLRLEVRSLVLQEVDRRFREDGIEIPFPQRDLHLRSVDGTALARLRDPASQ